MINFLNGTRENRYEICFDLKDVSIIAAKIAGSVSSFVKSTHMIETALQEAIYNAIEHGNLEITREKKRELINNSKFDEFLEEKISSQKNCKRKVYILSIVSNDALRVEIEDEGKGFDWKKELDILKSEKGSLLEKYSGFGLKIILEAFDEVIYNEKGNKLILVKYLCQKNREKR